MANHRINPDNHAPKNVERAATLLVCLGLALSLLSPHAIMTACAVGMIYGAWRLADGTWKWEARDNSAAVVNFTVVAFALGSAAICRFKGEPSGELEPYLSLLGAPLLGIGLRTMSPRPSLIAGALAAAAVLGAAAALWQICSAHEMQRASTQVAATSFGALGAIYAVVCAAMTPWAAQTRSSRTLLAVGTGAGVIVAVLSGSRGAWVILAVVLPVAVLSGLTKASRRKSIAFGLALAAVAVGSAALPNNPVGERVRETLRIGDPLRAAFARESARAFLSQPWSGIKRDDFAANLDRAWLSVRAYASHESPPRHSHNELLDAAAVRGAGGVLLNAMVLAVPIAVLWRLAKGERGFGPATTGLLFMAAFLLAGTTDLLLQLTSRRMTFLFIVLFCVIAATDNRKCRTPSARDCPA